MMHRLVPVVSMLAAISCARAPLAAPAAGAAPPNIVVFLVDDLGWQDVEIALAASPTRFNARYRTPALRRLAAQGMTFTDAYAAAPVCTPTRVALITGRTPAATHVTNWTQHRTGETSAPFPGLLPPDWARNGLSPDPPVDHAFHGPMLPALLRASGYRTIHVGKAHWGATDTPGADPRALGFDENIGGSSAGQPGSYLASKHFSSGPGEGKFRDVPGLEKYYDTDTFLTEALTREATAAMARAVAARTPFFLHLAHFAVHTPIEPDARFVQRYLDAGLDQREAAYASLIEGVDKSLGDVMQALERLGVLEQTLIIFASDNGGLAAHSRGEAPHMANAPLRSGKGSAYEGGVRVPFVVAWPGHVVGGTRSAAPVITDDLFPTLLRVAGVPRRAELTRGIRGRDLMPLLSGPPSAEALERPLYWHYPHYWGVAGPGIEPYSAIRVGQWKLIFYYADRRSELYDLASDLGESHDLAPTEPGVARRLRGLLRAALLADGAQMPIAEGTGRPVERPR